MAKQILNTFVLLVVPALLAVPLIPLSAAKYDGFLIDAVVHTSAGPCLSKTMADTVVQLVVLGLEDEEDNDLGDAVVHTLPFSKPPPPPLPLQAPPSHTHLQPIVRQAHPTTAQGSEPTP